MTWKIVEFELYYRARRPATYLYFLILFLVAFLGISIDEVTIGVSTGQVKQNAPSQIALMMVVLTAIPGFFITSAIMGVPVLRDYLHNSYEIIFTHPISKVSYLAGKFLGSLLVLIFIFTGILWGFMLGIHMPWVNSDEYLTFQPLHYIQPFFVFTIPNLLFTGALFFWGGVYNRSILWVFVQGVVLLVLYFTTGALASNWETKSLAAVLDPIGINLLNVVSRYWTISELNTQMYKLSGLVFVNRIFWFTIASIIIVGTYISFDSTRSRRRWWKKFPKLRFNKKFSPIVEEDVPLPQILPRGGWQTRIQQLMSLSGIYSREILFSVPFLAITIVGIVNIAINSNYFNELYGTAVLPTTSLMIELMNSFSLFNLIIITFYSGELVWRERDLQLTPIFDSLPISPSRILMSKYFGLLLVLILLQMLLILVGMSIQSFKGYFNYELGIYIKGLLIGSLSAYILYAILAFFVQIWTRNKFLGHTIFILFFLFTLFLEQLGLEHGMFKYASGGLDMYSDMNGYGHFIKPFMYYRLYWSGVAMILIGLSIVGYNKWRENDGGSRGANRLKIFTHNSGRLIIGGILLSLLMGSMIYYNTSILNQDLNTRDKRELQIEYEQTLKSAEYQIHPKIVSVSLEVDLYPQARDFKANGTYILVNKSTESIVDIHIQLPWDFSLTLDTLYFDRPSQVDEQYKKFQFWIYTLQYPLNPGDSLTMRFSQSYTSRGFREHQVNNEIVENGTFIKNDYFPSLGYNYKFELSDNKDRKKYDLPPQRGMRSKRDSVGLHTNIFGDDADYIDFDIQLSTDGDQIALAPGRLLKSWTTDNRNYFYYDMQRPMANFYSIVSAKYQIREDTTLLPYVQNSDSVFRLEIYYHPSHTYNIERMMEGMRKSLEYYSSNFAPYQYFQLRIMEFPKYRLFAQSFAQTIPFSEGMGFVVDVNAKDIDMAFYVTAHEVAHQWWGHQVLQANVKGNAFLSETLSQYSALMVMKQAYGDAMMQYFLKYELDLYLQGRATELRNELPLVLVENQDYIHYHKGSLAMYAFQDYISEDSLNQALKRYCNDWRFRTDRYPTADDLLVYFRQVTPDSLSYIIYDLFESITLYENRVLNPTYYEIGQGRFKVNIPVSSRKYRADSLGNERMISINDWIDIGILGRTSRGTDTLLYLNKHKIDMSYNEIEVVIDYEPYKAGIDPIHKLVDRNPGDNIAKVVKLNH